MRNETRVMDAGMAFWLAMFAASALGTNLGDLWVDELGLSRGVSFAALAAICGLAVGADRVAGGRTEAFYWVAVVALRAAATEVADWMTHDLRFDYLVSTLALGAVALGLGLRTRSVGGKMAVDGAYWAAMLPAGIFGTTGGDLVEHTLGMAVAAPLLTAMLAAVLAVRGRWFGPAVLGYWCAVLAERCAGTPVGDGLASRHGLGLGLPAATAVTLSLVLATLLFRGWRRRLARLETATA